MTKHGHFFRRLGRKQCPNQLLPVKIWKHRERPRFRYKYGDTNMSMFHRPQTGKQKRILRNTTVTRWKLSPQFICSQYILPGIPPGRLIKKRKDQYSWMANTQQVLKKRKTFPALPDQVYRHVKSFLDHHLDTLLIYKKIGPPQSFETAPPQQVGIRVFVINKG